MNSPVTRWHKKLDVQLADFWANEAVLIPATPDCKKGCSACCNERVFLNPAELVTIAAFLMRTLKRGALERMKRRVARLAKLVEVENIEEWWRNERPCPLLVANDCSVYSIRPIACRGRHSLDAKTCELDSPEGSKCLTGPQLIEAKIVTEAMSETEAAGADSRPVELIVGLDEALNGNGAAVWVSRGRGFPRATKVVDDEIDSRIKETT